MTVWPDDGTTTVRSAALLESTLRSYTDAQVAAAPSSSYPTAVRTYFISGTGSDANSGLAPWAAKRTIAAAYAALPSNGGTIILLPGLFDVGAGFAIDRAKLVDLIGWSKPNKVLGSTQTTPLTTQAITSAVIYSTSNPQALITTLGGTPTATIFGLKFINLVFQMNGSNMLYGIHATNVNHGEIRDCMFFADKTTDPCPVTGVGAWVHNDTTLGLSGTDASWWRIERNIAINTALVQLGNPVGAASTTSCNQNVVRENVGEGLSHTTAGCLPFIQIMTGHRCVVRDNNFEAYAVGLYMDHCWMCTESGDGGEVCDIFISLTSTHGCTFQPGGASFKAQGSATPWPWVVTSGVGNVFLVKGDSFTKRNIFILAGTEDASATNGNYDPTNDGTWPAISLASSDNLVISPRWSADFSDASGTFTSTPGAVTTVTIAHGLGATPKNFMVQAGNANAGTAISTRGMSVTADATNLTLTFTTALPGATSLAWNWSAKAL